MGDLGFWLLGPVEVRRDGEAVPLRTPSLTLVAGLLVSPNQMMSFDELGELVWDGKRMPTNPRAALFTTVSRLRRQLGEDAIESVAGGYRMPVDSGRLDLLRFGDLVGAAERAEQSGEGAEAVQLLDCALGLWRGSPLSNLVAPTFRREAASALTERYLAARERWAEGCIRLGRYGAVIAELTPLTETHPFREHFAHQLMTALFAEGRKAEALTVFERLRGKLRDELGVAPSVELQELHLKILRADVELKEPATQQLPMVPRQLPGDVTDFTGRGGELARIREVVGDGTGQIVVVAGQGGVGKTALALHVAHQLRGSFGDGQLYADLRGSEDQPVDPARVLAAFLHALGVVTSSLPDELEERAALFRSLVAERKLLVLLDNAADEAQVRPLLPGGSGAAVLVTSRRRLTGLSGLHLIELDVFKEESSLALLAGIIGERRISAEPDQARVLAGLCGGLPLALRVAGARLAARPHWCIAKLVERLGESRRRLNELSHGDLDVRAIFATTFQSLDVAAKTMLRRLGLLDVPDFAPWVGAALLDITVADAEEVLACLVDARLLEVAQCGSTGRPRYWCHDLIRLFAKEQALADETDSLSAAAVERAFGAWLALTEEAHRSVYGGDFSVVHGAASRWQPHDGAVRKLITEQPLVWLEGERHALPAVIRQAAETDLDELCWDLAGVSVTLFEARGYFDDWRTTHEQALNATLRTGNRRGQAALLQSLGSLRITQQAYGEAQELCEKALSLFSDAFDRHGQALARRRIALVHLMSGRLDAALQGHRQALQEFRSVGDRHGEASTLRGMARVRIERGEYEIGRRNVKEALLIIRATGSRRGEAQLLHTLGELDLRQGDFGHAEEAFRQVLAHDHRRR